MNDKDRPSYWVLCTLDNGKPVLLWAVQAPLFQRFYDEVRRVPKVTAHV